MMRSLINNVINCKMLNIHLVNGWKEGEKEGRKDKWMNRCKKGQGP